MQINLKQDGQPVADFSVSGANVTIAGVAIDCAARQQDIAVTVEVRQNLGGPSEGGNGAYLAQIEIPARRYETNTTIPAEGEDEQPTEVSEPLPLDPNAVVVTLWPTA
jgi:hypothetical protein